MPEATIAYIVLASAAGLLAAMLPVLFFQNRRAERTMRGLQGMLLEPGRAKLGEAKNILNEVLSGAIEKITANFDSMTAVLRQHMARAEALEKKLGVENKLLVGTADVASERIAGMTKTMENLVGNLGEIIANPKWDAVRSSAEDFNGGVGGLVKELESNSRSIAELSSELNDNIGRWSESGRRFSDELRQNIDGSTDKINMLSIAAKGMGEELSGLQRSIISDFENVKSASHGIERALSNSGELLARQLQNMENFTEQARKLLQSQVNTMSDTANRIGTDIRLAESSIETGAGKLNETTEKLSATSRTIKETFDAIAGEIMGIRAKFQTEVDDFSKNVLDNLQNAQAAAAHTMENAANIAAEFRDSVIPMLANVNGTVDGLEIARERIRPLSELMEKLESVLPDLADKSGEMTDDLTRKISDMAEKIDALNTASSQALRGIGDSTLALEKLSGESRQQMIDLMDDYAKAASTMRELAANMENARAASASPDKAAPARPAQDFARQIGGIIEKLHDLSVDLTRSIGAEIPDSVMEKYNDGDRAIFSKWFAKMIKSADKKRVRNMFRQDSVFRSQAMQFVHGFEKMLAGAERTDNRDMVVATLLKTDLGTMYQTLRACL
ncbi:MAG: hypothetical protein LBT45_00285 [Rickettsiales bacterium]|jgi:gas vesicle protein|nr:hypothetical protein [Rickettsiales bacterium]